MKKRTHTHVAPAPGATTRTLMHTLTGLSLVGLLSLAGCSSETVSPAQATPPSEVKAQLSKATTAAAPSVRSTRKF